MSAASLPVRLRTAADLVELTGLPLHVTVYTFGEGIGVHVDDLDSLTSLAERFGWPITQMDHQPEGRAPQVQYHAEGPFAGVTVRVAHVETVTAVPA